MSIDTEIIGFKGDLKLYDEKKIVRKYITYGNTHVINQDKYIDLKGEIAEHFKIHPNEVLMVGSGKMGFSISENLSEGKHRYRHFSDNSDIDIAIISQSLFDDIWKLLYEYIQDGAYWPKQQQFANYHFKGWMRPDKLPNTNTFKFTQENWWDFFSMITTTQKYGIYKIRGGLYRNWDFFETYQLQSIKQCKIELI